MLGQLLSSALTVIAGSFSSFSKILIKISEAMSCNAQHISCNEDIPLKGRFFAICFVTGKPQLMFSKEKKVPNCICSGN